MTIDPNSLTAEINLMQKFSAENIIDVLSNDLESDTRVLSALHLLENVALSDDQKVGILGNFLNQTNSDIVKMAIMILGSINSHVSRDLLRGFIVSENREVQGECLRALSRQKDEIIIDPCERALRSEDKELRMFSIISLGHLQSARALAVLERYLHDPQLSQREIETIAIMLARNDNSNGEAILIEAMKRECNRQLVFVIALAKLKNREGLNKLESLVWEVPRADVDWMLLNIEDFLGINTVGDSNWHQLVIDWIRTQENKDK